MGEPRLWHAPARRRISAVRTAIRLPTDFERRPESSSPRDNQKREVTGCDAATARVLLLRLGLEALEIQRSCQAQALLCLARARVSSFLILCSALASSRPESTLLYGICCNDAAMQAEGYACSPSGREQQEAPSFLRICGEEA